MNSRSEQGEIGKLRRKQRDETSIVDREQQNYKMEQGARKNVKKEQGEWVEIRREHGAGTRPPLRVSVM